ncbi:MAG: universal stress protein [Bacteroidetes bacterium]|nr:universal stress protein [Bacteroidota bacterium]
MKTIICPTDFSVNATGAAKYAAGLALTLEAELILIHGYESPVMYTEQPLAAIQLADEEVRHSAEKKMSTLKSRLQKEFRNLGIRSLLLEGASYDQLIAVADQHGADLIVMGTTGTTKLERLLMGSTTARVIRKANCPVICVPKDARFEGIKKIIFSTDLHEDNISSATALASFAKNFDAEIVFLYVDDKHLIHSDEEILRMTSKIRTRIKYPKISGYISKDPHITKGITYFLKKHPADLLVMFTHRKHFPESLLHPSVTKMMSHQTKIPLLSMKFTDQQILTKV